MDHIVVALRTREEADGKLAKTLIEGHRLAGINTKNTLKYLYSGIERLSWYGSCAFDDYKDICTRLKHEDIRTLGNLSNMIMNRDKHIKIFTLYFERLAENENLSEKERQILKENLRNESLRGSIYLAGLFAPASVTNRSLAHGLAHIIVSSPGKLT
ncbi:hypothetical protein [Entomohabitans teleogrylli]|uniref:hypothetical protein n=1 Tax=Entomohabitans teleogrylli TaxID=1384589 RepID=UPI000AEE1C79|nr:hypothetical protein [Entomohabitans teleogrylli]